jgi:TPR repeat protein
MKECTMRRRTVVVPALASLALTLSAAARAETSSWVTPSEPKASGPPKAASRPAAQPKRPKPRPPASRPEADPVTKFQPGEAPGSGTLGKATAPASGDDAAYIAFDQGQYLTALELAERAALRGDPQAHTLIGRIYGEGLGVAKDEVTAALWYARGAELGDVEAAFALGLMMAEGRGIEKDRGASARMLERAALQGHAYANYNLALLFLKGDGKPENPHRAAQHLLYAAEKGIAAAQYDLATLYQNGHGVPADAFEASRWMARAAGQGLPAAEYEYAVMLLRGFGLNSDVPKAIDYLRGAAEKGIAGAQNRLAHAMADGLRGEKNPVEAAKWRLLAKDSGIKDDTLDALVGKLSKAERLAAEKAAQEWRDRAAVGVAHQ